MMPRSSSSVPKRRTTLFGGLALGACLGLSALLSACGGQSDATSTDTGNPPVIIGQKLHVAPSDSGVVVSGDAGAVTPGASVAVENVTRRQSGLTTAAQDGSFQVELAGTPQDEYRVEASLGGRTTSVGLNAASGGATGLAGLEFLLEDATGFTPVTGTMVRLSFDDNDVSLNAGCNTLQGSYSQCDGKLCVSSLSTTDIGCPAPLHTQDEWLAEFLTAQPSLTRSGDRLTLATTDATLEFLDRELAEPDRALYGTWAIDTLIDGDSTSTFPPSPEPSPTPTVQFREDGTLAVSSGCHSSGGSFAVSGTTLTLSDIGYSEQGCLVPARESIAAHVEQVLSNGAVSFEIDAARLTILRGDIGLGASIE